MSEHLDVIVVGAGLSGIDFAYRLQTEAPSRRYAILEARDTLGGTWDLFRYPGVRSDSDMMTLGFPFEPWTDPDAIADGDKILDYLRTTARTYGIDERIRLGHKVVGASWSTPDARWTVTVEHDGATEELTCSFLHLCSGYYDYDRPHDARLPGIDAFEGPVVHPQFWPDDLEVAGRRVVVVGSGATAVSLVPALVDLGAEVTMLQRTPTWITSLPRRDKARDLVQRVLPVGAGGAVARYKSVLGSMGFYELSRRRPSIARSLLTKGATRALGSPEMVADHFTPTYDPWDQRLCLVPDGDLFAALRSGHADVVTGAIDTITADGVRLQDRARAHGRRHRDGNGLAHQGRRRHRPRRRRPSAPDERAHRLSRADARRGAQPRALHRLRQRVVDVARRPRQPLRLPVAGPHGAARVAGRGADDAPDRVGPAAAADHLRLRAPGRGRAATAG